MKGSTIVVYMVFVFICAAIGLGMGLLRVRGDLEVCRIYYPQMGTLSCLFSSKAIAVPGQGR